MLVRQSLYTTEHVDYDCRPLVVAMLLATILSTILPSINMERCLMLAACSFFPVLSVDWCSIQNDGHATSSTDSIYQITDVTLPA